MSQPSVEWTVSGFAYQRDPRSLADQLAAIAELGAIAPEALLLPEIRMLCNAYLAARRQEPTIANDSGVPRLIA